jgi:hypothetical protein
MTRLWIPADAIAVEVGADDLPVSLTWQCDRHAVDEIIRRWRVDTLWWTQRVWRDYFELSTRSGLMVVIYHDRIGGAWYLYRLYD